MNDVIIRAIGLSKEFKLYDKPHHRFLDVFGLMRDSKFRKHMALDGFDFEIRRGEKVAFIGRNGAGKSTLLKLITGVTQPTSGYLEVREGAHALLQIGTGFHPEFSGRENAKAYLAHLGVSGHLADEKILEIIDFSELEEYIDQPVKTYSSGMMARLMFATSTTIAPDLLVLDEILGVGDAYFANKSFERIKELAEQKKTTVLLVSHDIYSAAKLCSRMIWLDRGTKIIDGSSDKVVRAYEHSIRLQEESRLRTKAASIQIKARSTCVLELSVALQQPLRGQLIISKISIADTHGNIIVDFDLKPTSPNQNFEPSAGFIEHESRWGQNVLSENTAVKRTRLIFEADDVQIDSIASGKSVISIVYQASAENMICLDLWYKERCISRAHLPLEMANLKNDWRNLQSKLALPSDNIDEQADVIGTGRIWLEDIEIHDINSNQCFVFQPQDIMSIHCNYFTQGNNGLPVAVEFLIAFHRDGVTDVIRMIAPPLDFPENSKGSIEFSWAGWALGRGRFTVTLMAVKPGYFDDNDGKFYSINDGVYFVSNRAIEIFVDGGSNKYGGTNIGAVMNILIGTDGLYHPHE